MPLPEAPGFAVLVEADGLREEAEAARGRILDALSEDAVAVHAPLDASAADAVWRWREGIAHAVTPCAAASSPRTSPCRSTGWRRRSPRASSRRPATASTRSASATPATATSTRTSWSTSRDPARSHRAEEAGEELFAIALRLGGTISGEHGVGRLKAGHLHEQWPARAVELHGAVKAAFDPKGLLNPGAKRP